MDVNAIISFLTARDLGYTIAYENGSVVEAVATYDDARAGDVAWTLPFPQRPFQGSLLLNDKLAMVLVIREFFLQIWAPMEIDESVRIGNGTVTGGEGFGFVWDGEKYLRWPHVGGLIIEADVELGDNNTVDRGSIGNTIIRRGVKTDNLVHIAHNDDIGEHTLIAAGTTLSGSVKIGERCYLGAGVVVSDHLTIGDDVVIGAGAVVVKDVPAGQCWMGNPARYHKEASDVPRP